MLEHYFGSGLLVYVSDILESDPPVQLAPPDCARLALNAVSKIAAVRDAKAIALMFRFIIADAVLQRCYNNR
jgi:hypothetical protein